jgi:hypothetical protein
MSVKNTRNASSVSNTDNIDVCCSDCVRTSKVGKLSRYGQYICCCFEMKDNHSEDSEGNLLCCEICKDIEVTRLNDDDREMIVNKNKKESEMSKCKLCQGNVHISCGDSSAWSFQVVHDFTSFREEVD